MKIQWDTHLIGTPVVDQDGHRLGRITTAYCTTDAYTAVWFVLRLPGLRRRWRAVPAQAAHWNDTPHISLRVPYRRDQVLASVIDEDSLDTADHRVEVEAFYTARLAGAAR